MSRILNPIIVHNPPFIQAAFVPSKSNGSGERATGHTQRIRAWQQKTRVQNPSRPLPAGMEEHLKLTGLIGYRPTPVTRNSPRISFRMVKLFSSRRPGYSGRRFARPGKPTPWYRVSSGLLWIPWEPRGRHSTYLMLPPARTLALPVLLQTFATVDLEPLHAGCPSHHVLFPAHVDGIELSRSAPAVRVPPA